MYDVIIVGGGPAGLSAALVLGRCRRRVVLFDDGKYRNFRSGQLHGFLTRDGIDPAELRRIGREQLGPYGVELRTAQVRDARRSGNGFEIVLDDDTCVHCRKLLLATGVIDHVPAIAGMDQFYGRGVYHCPYCDGWEVRGQPLAAYGRGKNVAELALSLKTWSAEVMICSDGPAGIPGRESQLLERHGIRVYEGKIARLEPGGGESLRIVFRDTTGLERKAIFLSTGQQQRCDLASRLGCRFTSKGAVHTGKLETTNIPGLYVAGDASKDVQLAIVSAAEGAKAGFAINSALQAEDLA